MFLFRKANQAKNVSSFLVFRRINKEKYLHKVPEINISGDLDEPNLFIDDQFMNSFIESQNRFYKI